MAEESQEKWEGKICAKLTGTTADQIWPLYEDFCNNKRWLEILDTSYHLEGSPAPGQPGCIRYCSGPAIPSRGVHFRMWAHERLLQSDPIKRCLIYDINESNMGFDNYVATIRVLPGEDDNQSGCTIEWTFVTNPMKGWTLEKFVSLLESCLDGVVKRMEEAIHGHGHAAA